MNRWIEDLTRIPLAEAGVLLSDKDRASLSKESTQALLVDVPVLRNLRAAELVTADLVVDNRLWLVFQLAETTQQSIELSTREAVRASFLREVQKARVQLETVEWRIREAMGEGRAPGDGAPDDSDESSTRAIRERVRRHEKGGQLTIPGIPVSRRIEVGPVPRTLTRGPKLRISAQVASMTRTRAILERVVVCPLDMGRAQTIPGLFECKVLERDLGAAHRVIGESLLNAMDTRRTLNIDVMLVLD